MKRREVLAGAGCVLTAGVAGCASRLPGMGLSTEFEEVGAELDIDEPPEVTVEDGTVTARGTVQHGSSTCGAVELAHAEYEHSQSRLDLLVIAADDSGWTQACTDDLVAAGYRVTATVGDDLRRVAVTEHHVFGDTYSTTVDLDEA